MLSRPPRLDRLLAAYAASRLGSTAAEYALVLTVLGGCALILLHSLGHRMDHILESAANAMNGH